MNKLTRCSEKGFTLMEVVTAVFIFLLGIVGVISLFAAAAVFHKGASDKTRVSLALQQVISEIDLHLRRGGSRDGNDELMPVSEGRIPGFKDLGYEAYFEETGLPGDSMVLSRIAITWMERGKVKRETFDYVFRPGAVFSESIDRMEAEQKLARDAEKD